jgi:hypothetical protein
MDQNIELLGNNINIEELRAAYNTAVAENKGHFMFSELPLVTEYVKDLLNRIDSQSQNP